MSPQLLGMVLWIPFGLVALIAGLIYCISGYKKGLWRALGSLVTVALSTAGSVLLARALAGALAPTVATMIPVTATDEATAVALQVLLTSVVAVVLAMVLFGLLMLILTPILGAIISLLLGKSLHTDSKPLKLLGMVTGLVSALVFTLCWLSPVYGTLATAAPVAQIFLSGQEAEDADMAQLADYMDAVGDHLLVKASAAGPAAMVYDSLSQVPVGDTTVSMMDMSNALGEAAVLIDQIRLAKEPVQFTQISTQLVELIRDSFVSQDWFYDLFRDLMMQLQALTPEVPEGTGDYTQGLLELAEMTKTEFREVMSAVLDFAKFALEKNILILAEDMAVHEIYESGVLEEMGRVLNSSSQMVELKKVALAMMLGDCGLDYQEAKALLEEHQVGQVTETKDQLREVEALLLPAMGQGVPTAITVLRHPGLGGSALLDIRDQVGFARMLGMDEGTELKLTVHQENAIILALMSMSKMTFEELAALRTDISELMNPGGATTEQAGTPTVTPDASAGQSGSATKPSNDKKNKDKIKQMIDKVGISGAKDMLDKMGEEEKEDIKNTLDKMGVDSISDAKAMVDKMEVEDIVNVMENMGFGGLVDQMDLEEKEDIPDLGDLSKEDLDKISKGDLDKVSKEDLGNLSKEDLLNMMNKAS